MGESADCVAVLIDGLKQVDGKSGASGWASGALRARGGESGSATEKVRGFSGVRPGSPVWMWGDAVGEAEDDRGDGLGLDVGLPGSWR